MLVSVVSLHATGCPPVARAQTALPAMTLPVVEVLAPAKPPQKRRAATAQQRDAKPTDAGDRPAPAVDAGPAVTATTAGPVRGYEALTATTATRTATPIERIPQSVAVVPRAVIDDQQALTVSEALRNVASVGGIPPLRPYGVDYKVRGFPAERYLDGLSNYNDAGDYTSLVNVERIEVLKGPGGLFYQGGLGVLGGVINTVSKLPVATPQYQAGLTTGTFGLWNPWFDVNQPLAPNALFRMTGEFVTSRDYIELIDRRSFSFYPTLTFADLDTRLTIQGNFSRREGRDYVGLPGAGTVDTSQFTVRRDMSIGDPSIPKGFSEGGGITVRLDRDLSPIWSLQVPVRYSEAHVNEPSQIYFLNTPDVPPSRFAILNWHLIDDARDLTAAPTLVAKFAAGPTTHTFLLGADVDRAVTRPTTWGAFAGLADLANPHPVFPPYRDPAGTGTEFFDAANVYVNAGATVQLQSTFFDRLNLLAGVRWAYADVQNSNLPQGTAYHAVNQKPLPRVGAAFEVLRGVTLFADYSEGLRGVRFFTGAGVPNPEEAKQIEGGVKLALPFGLAGTLAVFDIRRRNIPTGDPFQPFLQVQAGEERSKGFDADLTWQPFAGLSVLASYAHVDARVTEDIFFPVGNRVDFVPEDSGRLWAIYKFQRGLLRNLSVGGGFYAGSRQAINLDNQFFTPGFVTFDARLAYDFENYTFALVGKNLTDRRYFIPYPFFQGRVAPGEPLTVLASITVRR
jgi:iron complex outermembrane receptor protein